MDKHQAHQLFSTFMSRYDADAKDHVWVAQSHQFREFWKNKILSNTHAELDDADIDAIVRILDKNGKGNSKESEVVARVMIPQGAWRRMFNEIKASSELSGTITGIFDESDLN